MMKSKLATGTCFDKRLIRVYIQTSESLGDSAAVIEGQYLHAKAAMRNVGDCKS